MRADRYTYRVEWSAEDEAYVARVAEFELLATHGDTLEEALREAQQVVEAVIEEMEADGDPVPSSFGQRKFSGKFLVRIPPRLHRELVVQAHLEGVSLNQLVTTKLAASF